MTPPHEHDWDDVETSRALSTSFISVPKGQGGRNRPLTKPVRGARQRPTPRWVGWFLILLPTLAAGGPLLGVGPVFAFRIALIVLFCTAAWDWWRFQDRSRTFGGTIALGSAFLVAGLIALGYSRPPLQPALLELLAVALMFGGALALVQLYRSAETLLTMARGWLYALGLVVIEAIWEIVTGNRLPNFYLDPSRRGSDIQWTYIAGPFHNPNQLAAACNAALLILPIGFALEHDRRLKWAYPAVAAFVPVVAYYTTSTLGLLLSLAILGVWVLLYKWGRIIALPTALVLLAVLPQGRRAVMALIDKVGYFVDTAGEVGYSSGDRINLIRDGVWMMQSSDFVGVGPGGFSWAMEHSGVPYPTAGIVNPHWAVTEIASQYGLGIAIMVALALIGVGRWAVQRLARTRGAEAMSQVRAPAVWGLIWVAIWPVLSLANSAWISQSMSALQVATFALLARHMERPKGRRVVPQLDTLQDLPAGPGQHSAAAG